MAIASSCPHCGHATSWSNPPKAALITGTWKNQHPYFGIALNGCPTCERATVWLETGEWFTDGSGWAPDRETISGRWVYPANASRPIDERVPSDLRKEFAEAESVLPISPNASAALSRRILQRALREHANVAGRNLAGEIDAYLEKQPPSHIAAGLHDVRGIGNTAAHGEYDAAGLIFDVTAEEAAYTLEIVYALLDHLIVAPARAAEVRAEFNERRRAAGIRELPDQPVNGAGN